MCLTLVEGSVIGTHTRTLMAGQDVLPGLQEFKDQPSEAISSFPEIPALVENKNSKDQGPELPNFSEFPEFQPDQNILEPGQKGGRSICDHHCASEVSSPALD